MTGPSAQERAKLLAREMMQALAEADVVVLAGDISVGLDGLAWAADEDAHAWRSTVTDGAIVVYSRLC